MRNFEELLELLDYKLENFSAGACKSVSKTAVSFLRVWQCLKPQVFFVGEEIFISYHDFYNK